MAELIALNLFVILLAFQLGWKLRGARDAAWIERVIGGIGWQYRSPLYRDIHPDQEAIGATDFRPLQHLCIEAHFSVKTPRQSFKAPKLSMPKRWANNWS